MKAKPGIAVGDKVTRLDASACSGHVLDIFANYIAIVRWSHGLSYEYLPDLQTTVDGNQ